MENALPARRTRALLACGMWVAPVFYLTAAAQLPFRPDYSIRQLPLSYLALGELGWVQVLNFVATGALAMLCAIGIRDALRGQRGGSWGPALVGLFGLGMAAAGIFGPDPFPQPGAAAPPPMSTTGALHMLAFFIAFLSLIAATFVFAAHFRAAGRGGWAVYCIASGLLTPVLVAASMANPASAGPVVAGAGFVLFGWLSIAAARLHADATAGGRLP